MSGTIRDEEYDLLRQAIEQCEETDGGDVLDRVLSAVEDILEAREEPLRKLASEWATDGMEFDTHIGFRIVQNAEQRCASAVLEILNEWDQDCVSEEDDDTEKAS